MQISNITNYDAWLNHTPGGGRDPEAWYFSDADTVLRISTGSYGEFRGGLDFNITFPVGFKMTSASLFLYVDYTTYSPGASVYVYPTQLNSAVSDTPGSVSVADLYAAIASGTAIGNTVAVPDQDVWLEIPLNSTGLGIIESNKTGNTSSISMGLMSAQNLAHFRSSRYGSEEPYLVIKGSMPQMVMIN